MFDMSLNFKTTTDVSLVDDYTVIISVQVMNTPRPPYSDLSQPVVLTIPVSVRNCALAATPSIPVNLTSS